MLQEHLTFSEAIASTNRTIMTRQRLTQKAPKQEIELAEKRMMEVYDNESTYLE